MPLLDQLTGSSSLTISRFPDFDHFRSLERLVEARSIPLQWTAFDASVATVKLGSCSIHLQRTFPRILQARYSTSGALVGLAMDDRFSVTLNGVEVRTPTLLLVKGAAICDVVEPRANLVAFVNFESIDDRGWPDDRDRAQLVTAGPAEFQALQMAIRGILALASASPEVLLQPRMIEHLEKSLLQAVDHAMHSASPVFETRHASLAHYLSLVRKLDELLRFTAGSAIYSADVAKQLGVSVRTLHNAVVAIRGMSIQRYTRLTRLWNVRQHLAQGAPTDTVKAAALANGFWHMGDFGSCYRDLFGETPQQTLLASRRQDGGLS